MKKQGIRKLVLSRETVRIMDQRLEAALGRGDGSGRTCVTCDDSCPTLVGSFCTCTNGPLTHCI
jgi:hypothetical protein